MESLIERFVRLMTVALPMVSLSPPLIVNVNAMMKKSFLGNGPHGAWKVRFPEMPPWGFVGFYW